MSSSGPAMNPSRLSIVCQITLPTDHQPFSLSAVSRSAVPLRSSGTNERKIMHLEHIGIVVDDLAAATEFFTALGLEVEGETSVEGDVVDRINGLEGVQADIVILRTPDGNGSKLELAKYRSPSYDGDDGSLPANAPGIRHVLFAVDDIEESLGRLQARGGELVGELVNYENVYWLCYVRGPAGIIVELAQKIG